MLALYLRARNKRVTQKKAKPEPKRISNEEWLAKHKDAGIRVVKVGG